MIIVIAPYINIRFMQLFNDLVSPINKPLAG